MKTEIQKATRKNPLLAKTRKAFSLVELLVVIAVIGIIAAIAIPNIAGITGSAEAAKTQRNAQSIASAFASARAAGNADSIATVDAAVDALTASPGMAGVGANFADAKFYVPLSDAEITAVKGSTLLTIEGAAAPTTSTLVYTTP